ncbi:acyl-CoA thioesterase [Kitasatospora sp. NPDC048298]|uniref:acyl-CoA thioesterase n=1 Tax=Kitasatospora sp. NPDC048298 TaxID=3364049 RepID=UPI0037161373
MQPASQEPEGRRFRLERRIFFHHCDPAGIVFYPQYLVLLNEAQEAWFSGCLGVDYAALFTKRLLGVPTVRLECDFIAPSRLGDSLTLELAVERIGTKSLTIGYEYRGTEAGEVRARFKTVLVFTSLETHRAVPIPDDIQAGLRHWLTTRGDSEE